MIDNPRHTQKTLRDKKHTTHGVVQYPQEFFSDFIQLAQRASQRIWIQTMIFQVDEKIQLFEEILISAVTRGVDARLTIDWVNKRMVDGDVYMLPIINRKKRKYAHFLHRNRKILIKKLKKAGVNVTITNTPLVLERIIPHINRNHIKIYVVDNIAWIGGIGLSSFSLENIDFMVKFDDVSTVNAITQQFLQVNRLRPKHNYSVVCNSDYTFFVDCGLHGRSIIYNTARLMIQKATKEIIFVSQFLPDGPVLRSLIEKAKQHIPVSIITSNKDDNAFTRFPDKYFYLRSLKKIKKYPNIRLMYGPTKVHAKLLLIDRKEALFGSHNMVQTGVWAGTEEVSIQTTDTKLVKQLYGFVNSL